ncbi:hypothetical protein HanPI659440_Chr16g0639591 [Helianthus annuus]|nr:hypothetical protein HanPI659440_Chr16g0639591 [Helianthus annuus]
MQAKSSNFYSKHNICCTLDKTLSKMEPFEEILDFIDQCQLKKALTDKHKAYRSHIERFWTGAKYEEADKAIHSFARIKENDEDKDIEVIITPADIRRMLDLKDNGNDPVGLSERLCKGLWFRMGFMGFVNESHYNKQNLSQPYKFLVHSVIHAMGYRKGGYDVEVDYIMCMVTSLILNRPYNYSQVIFEHMKANAAGEKFLQYSRFIQMNLDDKIKNLEKNEKDELVPDHMTNVTLERLQVYKKKKPPPKRRKFAFIEKPDYVAPSDNKWRHDDSDLGNEDKQMELFELKRSKWFIKDEEKKNKGKRGTPKKATTKKPVQRQLIDEPSEDEAQNVEENVETGAAGPSTAEVTQEIEDIVFGVTENVGDNVQAGDVNVEGIAENVEGVESSGSSDIDVTQIAPATSYPMAKWRKKKEKTSKKRKNIDDEDATYEPQIQKLVKCQRD